MEKKEEIHIPWGSGIVGYVAQSGEPVNIPDAYKVGLLHRSYYLSIPLYSLLLDYLYLVLPNALMIDYVCFFLPVFS